MVPALPIREVLNISCLYVRASSCRVSLSLAPRGHEHRSFHPMVAPLDSASPLHRYSRSSRLMAAHPSRSPIRSLALRGARGRETDLFIQTQSPTRASFEWP